jgi:hypothetical protein
LVQTVADPTQSVQDESHPDHQLESPSTVRQANFDMFRSRCFRMAETSLPSRSSRTSHPQVGSRLDSFDTMPKSMQPQKKSWEGCKKRIPQDKLDVSSRSLSTEASLQSHLFLALLTMKTPCRTLKAESQTPVEASNPTQFPPRLALGLAQARHSEVEGPVHVLQAGEQLSISWPILSTGLFCLTHDRSKTKRHSTGQRCSFLGRCK